MDGVDRLGGARRLLPWSRVASIRSCANPAGSNVTDPANAQADAVVGPRNLSATGSP